MTDDKLVEKVARALVIDEYHDCAFMTWNQIQEQAPITASKFIDTAKVAIPIIQAEIEARHEEEIATVTGLHEARKIEAYREGAADTQREIADKLLPYTRHTYHTEGTIRQEEVHNKNCTRCVLEAFKSGTWKEKK